MNAWTKVVTNPLGLAAFALFLAYLAARKLTGKNKDRIQNIFLGLAIISSIAGLYFGYVRETKDNLAGPEIQQQTQGTQSPAVAGVNGNVTITNQSASTTPAPNKNADQKNADQKKGKP